jgi:hypothetical protein
MNGGLSMLPQIFHIVQIILETYLPWTILYLRVYVKEALSG